MFDTNELNDKLVSELRPAIAKNLGIAEADDLRKASLINKIVEQEQLIEAARTQQKKLLIPFTRQKAPHLLKLRKKSVREYTAIKNSNEPRRGPVRQIPIYLICRMTSRWTKQTM